MEALPPIQDEFHLQDVIAEPGSLPVFLQCREAEVWLGHVVAQLRAKNCGLEELAWLFGFPLRVLNDALPSSAAAELIGTDFLSIGFLPKGSGCIFDGSTSNPHLNGRKCTLVVNLLDGAPHAQVLVEGGPGATLADSDPKKTILLARKNLSFARVPSEMGSDGWPSLALAEGLVEEEPEYIPRDLLGEAWINFPTRRPSFLRSPETEMWLAGLVGRLVSSKSCGREELQFLLNLPEPGSNVGFGGQKLPSSVSPDNYNLLLDEIGFVVAGSKCVVEGSRSYAHLNGRVGNLLQCCPDGVIHAKINLGDDGDLQIHRKNLRLLEPGVAGMTQPPASGMESAVGMLAPTQVAPSSLPSQSATVAHAELEPLLPHQTGTGEGKLGTSHETAQTSSPGMFGWLFGCGACSKATPAQVSVQQTKAQQYPSAPTEGNATVQQAEQMQLQPIGPSTQPATIAAFCSGCGFKFLDNGKFCPGCGRHRDVKY